MKKREFVKLVSASTLSILAANSFIGCDNTEKKPKENILEPTTEVTPKEVIRKSNYQLPKKWIWIQPNIRWSDDKWKTNFERIKSAGIEAVVPQVYASEFALFDHPTMPVRDNWLERMIPLAHAAGLEIHGWMWTMPLNNKKMIAEHPDWFSVNRRGEPAHTHPAYVHHYKFMCPCNDEVAEFVAGNVEALAKIEGLDGIHLDYVRQPDVILAEALQPRNNVVQDKEYPQYDYPYSENCRNQFKEQTGIDPMDLGDEAPQHEAWRQFRYDAVSNIVNNHCVPMARKYDKPITAAVFPNWESVRQEWHNWDLDGFLPMLYHGFYNKGVDWIGEEVKKGLDRLELLKNDKPVYSGLFLPHLKTGEALKQAIESSEANGASGIALFSYGNFKERHYEMMKQLYG